MMGQYGSVLVGTWWYCVSIGWYWLMYDGTVLGQYRVVLVGTWLYWVSMEQNWLIYDGSGSI